MKVLGDGRVLDEGTYLVEISPPEIPENLSLKLEYETESKNSSDIYRIYGYLINKGAGSAEDIPVNLTVTDERTGEIGVCIFRAL